MFPKFPVRRELVRIKSYYNTKTRGVLNNFCFIRTESDFCYNDIYLEYILAMLSSIKISHTLVFLCLKLWMPRSSED